MAVAPALDEMVLERLELVPVSSRAAAAGVQPAERRGAHDLRRGAGPAVGAEAVQDVSPDPERAAGGAHAAARSAPRCPSGCATRAARRAGASCSTSSSPRARRSSTCRTSQGAVVLGSAQMLADQPEFASNARMRDLLRLTEGRDLLEAGARGAAADGALHHHRRREPRCAAERLHAGHLLLRGRRPQGRHRRHGTDTDAVRQDHRAGGAHQPAGGGSAGVSEFYALLGVAARRVRGRHQEGLPEAGDGVPSRPQSRRPRRRPSSRRSPRRTRCCAIRRSARPTTATARPASAAAAAASGFHHVDLSEALNIFMRDFGGMGGFESLFGGGRGRGRTRAAARTCG